jgi:hypothetical protein
MSTEGTFLRNIQFLVIEDNTFIRTGLEARFTSPAFRRVDNNDAVRPFIDSMVLTGIDTGSGITVLADGMVIGNFNLGYRTPYFVYDPCPELPAEWLGFGDGTPVITDMLIFTGNLAVMTTVTFSYIYNEYLTHGYRPYSSRVPV